MLRNCLGAADASPGAGGARSGRGSCGAGARAPANTVRRGSSLSILGRREEPAVSRLTDKRLVVLLWPHRGGTARDAEGPDEGTAGDQPGPGTGEGSTAGRWEGERGACCGACIFGRVWNGDGSLHSGWAGERSHITSNRGGVSYERHIGV